MRYWKLLLDLGQLGAMGLIDMHEVTDEIGEFVDEFYDSHNLIYSITYFWFWLSIICLTLPIGILVVRLRIKHNDSLVELIEKYKD